MHRKSKRAAESGILNLDSLMDILSCLVGVMLFLVMYTVLELGSATYHAAIPIVRDPPPGSRRVVVLCDHGTVRVLDIRAPLAELLSGFEIVVAFSEVPVFLRGNRLAPTDQYFRYELKYEDRLSRELLGTLDLQIHERTGVVGDSIHQLGEGSRYATLLEELNPEDSWLAFAVDSTGVDVFRRARELAIARGFTTGWDPFSLNFPLTHALSGGGAEDGPSPRSTLSKPPR